ncbi:MAG: energy transducer TonB [Sphingomonas sp.]
MPLLLIGLATATPAAAQQVEWGRQGNIVIYRDATGCSASGTTTDGVTAALREDVDGSVTLNVSMKQWRYAAGKPYPIELRGEQDTSNIPSNTVKARGFRAPDGRRGLSLPLPEALGDQYAWQSSVAVTDAATGKLIATVPSLFGADSLRHRCAVELGRVDRGSGKPVATPARLREPPVDDNDYPPAALRAEDQGVTIIRVTVSAKGLVSACTIHASSGSAMLDQTACGLMSRRARYMPALDAAGQPTQDEFLLPFRWEIPEV